MSEDGKASGYSSPVIVPRTSLADAIASPTPEARAQGLVRLLLGAEYSAAKESILHADPDLSRTVAIEGFGTSICLTSPSHLLLGQVAVLVRGTDWLATVDVSARPIALFQVVEIQPPRLRKIYGAGPDKILLAANEPIFALNQFGTASAEIAATATDFLKFHDFIPATDIRLSHQSAIQLAGPGSAPIIGQKRGHGTDESFHPFRALLMLDKDLFQVYVCDAPTVTDLGFLARMRSLVPEQFRARLLAG